MPGGLDSNGTIEDPDDDNALMRALKRGEMQAFEQLVRKHLGFVVRHARRFVNDANTAEDVAQNVFLRLLRVPDLFREETNFCGWLATMTTRLALNELRTRRRKPWLATAPSGTEPTIPSAAHNGAAHAADPEESLLREERIAQVRAAIQRLPARQRDALILQRFEQWDLPAIGAALGLSVAAVKSLLFRARATLSRELEAYIRSDDARSLISQEERP